MRIVFLYNESAEDPAFAAEDDVPAQSPIVAGLRRLRHVVTPIACTLDLLAAREQLERAKPDVVFNRVESLGGSDAMMGAVPLLLETMQIPYTGCSSEALAATASKLTVKERLVGAGLPTPGWITSDGATHGLDDRARSVFSDHPLSGVQFGCGNPQFIVKSVYEHASFQMDDHALVEGNGPAPIIDAIQQREAATGRPFFAEQFIPGREFNLSVWGAAPEVLPPAEIDFSAFAAAKPRIVAHRAKCDDASFEYHHTPRRFDFPAVDAPLLRRLSELTLDCARLFNLQRGYARVDFRCDAFGQPWILEINSNPCFSPHAGFAAALARAGIQYNQAIQRLLDQALARWPRPETRGCESQAGWAAVQQPDKVSLRH